MNANRILPLICGALCTAAPAQQNLETAYRTTGQSVTAAFEAQRAVLQTSSAVITSGREESAYGVVVSSDGYLLTKASEVQGLGEIVVTVDRQRYKGARILVVDPEWDVALIKIDAAGLLPVVYAPTSEVPQGSWVVVNGATTRTKRRALAGIVSAKIREIPASGGAALGVVLKQDGGTLEIEEVNEKSGAREAGLRKGDLILKIEDQPVKNIKELSEALKERKAGTNARITIRRDGGELTLEVRLSARNEMFADEAMMNRNDMMSGNFSKRRSGFPRVLQHDVMASAREMGGPVLDLDGRCLGMNIARANRSETFAIPVEQLREIAARLIKKAAETPAPETGGQPQ